MHSVFLIHIFHELFEDPAYMHQQPGEDDTHASTRCDWDTAEEKPSPMH